MKRLPLTNPQMAIYQAGWQPESRFRVAVCGRRFGKTTEAAEEIRRAVRRMVAEEIGVENEIWYAAPTYKQAKKIFWPRLKQIIPRRWLASKARESDLTLQVGPSSHIIRVVGLENYDALRGVGLYFFLGDEWADTIPQVWPEVIRPMLSTVKGHALFIGTPKGHDHFYDLYMKGQAGPQVEKGWWSRAYTTLDGGQVSVDEIASARSSLDARQFRQEYEASFESYSGRCLYAFSRAQSVRDVYYKAGLPLHIGLDFNVNPMSATVWQEEIVSGGNITSYQIDEIILPTSNTDEMSREIISRYVSASSFNSSSSSEDRITIYPDPAGNANKTSACGKTDISILKSYGFRINVAKKSPTIRDRLNLTNSMFESATGERRVFISPRCVKSIECYEKYCYRDGTSEPDKSGGYDHVIDATGYYLYFRFSKKENIQGKIPSFER